MPQGLLLDLFQSSRVHRHHQHRAGVLGPADARRSLRRADTSGQAQQAPEQPELRQHHEELGRGLAQNCQRLSHDTRNHTKRAPQAKQNS